MRIRIVTEGASSTPLDKGPAAHATGPFSRTERPSYFGESELLGAGSEASAPAGFLCFLDFFSVGAGAAESVAPGSAAVAELGVPLEAALSASGAGAAAGSVGVDHEDGVWLDDGGVVVWAEGSVAGAVCWARADPA